MGQIIKKYDFSEKFEITVDQLKLDACIQEFNASYAILLLHLKWFWFLLQLESPLPSSISFHPIPSTHPAQTLTKSLGYQLEPEENFSLLSPSVKHEKRFEKGDSEKEGGAECQSPNQESSRKKEGVHRVHLACWCLKIVSQQTVVAFVIWNSARWTLHHLF